ncbi:Acetyl-CoA carboxylase [Raphanus sativus]|nr:Acetyl-CoA carboxylase [Raphanus sativus]
MKKRSERLIFAWKRVEDDGSSSDLLSLFINLTTEDLLSLFRPQTILFLYYQIPIQSRHLEVQLLCDQIGNVSALHSRDCSVQRRHQKIIEEGPITVAPQETIKKLEQAARRLGSVNYVGAATVEYLYSMDTIEFYFLELNHFSYSRHLEVQLLCDQIGNVSALHSRDCSVQRRHQKVIEEGPITVALQETIKKLEQAARRLASVNYVGAATDEYLYSMDTIEFYFLELNHFSYRNTSKTVVADISGSIRLVLKVISWNPLLSGDQILQIYRIW